MKKVLASFICLFALSCEKPGNDPVSNSIEGSGIEFKDGIAVFNDMETFLSTSEKIGALNGKDYDEWSEKNKFYSRYTEYREEIGKKTISEINLRPEGSLIKNEKGGYFQLNSVNSNYARITNKDGLVMIGGSTYQFTYSEIKKIDGTSQSSISSLLNSKTAADYQRNRIMSSEVKVVSSTDPNARTFDESVVVERKTQQGPDISGDAFWNWYLDATLEIRGYSLPGCAICPTPTPGGYIYRYTAVVELFYYSDGLIDKDKETPERFELAWTYVRHHPPLAENQGETITGSYTESGVNTVLRTISDGGKILSYDIEAKALDDRFNETLKTSGTRIIRTQ
ncbi:hypothetical protein SAMN05216327_116111 [Dyadobacter sp. SG02]|uniref:hypothetical protein n=1 Tax=Dyadobacter sp. SG02 TaxID=1855291 RepID=UPI0008B31CA4|nr:hypothetical protein [Dyadobacter sp. SG02]SEJ69303.1 hypothetical protein SAMN05216327_116111 [Dyadobacter sp. SG02]